MGEISLGRGCPAARRSPDRIENRASRSARTRAVQSILVDRIDRRRRLDDHADFWSDESPRTACLHRIELCHLRPVGDRSSRHFSGNASFNACAREFSDCLRCRGRSYVLTSGQLLVAAGFRASGLLFRFHLATLRGKGERSARHSRLLLGAIMIYIYSLGRAARYFPERMALVSNARRSTFRELDARVGRVADALTRHGFKAGDRLAILLPNEPDYIELIYACAWLGVIAIPLNTRLSAKEIDNILADAKPRGLIRHSSLPRPSHSGAYLHQWHDGPAERCGDQACKYSGERLSHQLLVPAGGKRGAFTCRADFSHRGLSVHVRRAGFWHLSGHGPKVQSAELLRDGRTRTHHAHGVGPDNDQYAHAISGAAKV